MYATDGAGRPGDAPSCRVGPEGPAQARRTAPRAGARLLAAVRLRRRARHCRCIVSIHRRTSRRPEGGGVLEFAILGLLHQSPMHGYELRKQLAQVLGGLRSISYGSLYPALKRMHAAGLIATDEPDPHALLPADAPPLTGRRGQGRLHDHRRGQGALPRAGQPDRPGGLRRRRALRRPPGVLPAHRRRRPAADPRGPPAHRRAAARGAARRRWPAPASGSTATRSSCSATASSRWTARSAGSPS